MDLDSQTREVAKAYKNVHRCDPYTVVFKDGYALALSEHPEQAEGVAPWILIDDYDVCSLGQQVSFDELPENVQKYVLDQINNDI